MSHMFGGYLMRTFTTSISNSEDVLYFIISCEVMIEKSSDFPLC